MSKSLTGASLLLAFLPMAALPATWYVDGTVAQSGEGTSWYTAFKTVHEGIIAADEGDTVVVAPGIYNGKSSAEDIPGGNAAPARDEATSRGAFPLGWKNITLRSVDPLNPQIVASTILDGGGTRSVIWFDGAEDPSMVLSGFTIRNGNAPRGGGINGSGTHATIRNNIIINNVAEGRNEGEGGGLYDCDGVIEGNVIEANQARYWEYSIMSRACGGGLYGCNGTMRNNLIKENYAWTAGGGLFGCGGIIQDNIIVGNRAGEGAGMAACEGTMRNCIIWANSAGTDGGGLYMCADVLIVRNSVIAFNSARYAGGGLAFCDGSVRNSIIWGNAAAIGAQLHDSSVAAYSCVQGLTEGGEGNISQDPRFVDAEKGDFRLRPDSPCIDMGYNDPELQDTDIVGMHRIMFGGMRLTVDMGAYEFYINKLEPVPGTHEAIFTWSSLSNKTYSIFYTDDLFTWHTAIDNFPSSGNTTTSWLDDGSLTGVPPLLAPKRFYRLLENP